MYFELEAACGCNIGRIRANNEDNFLFAGKTLRQENKGLRNPVTMQATLNRTVCLGVFDGMGGENYGEIASYVAARTLRQQAALLNEYVIPERYFLQETADLMNRAVVERARELLTTHMGTTAVMACITPRDFYLCNLGDSRAFRLRDGEFLQITKDHVEQRDGGSRKAPLTQYLGIDPEEMLLEPHIAKGTLVVGDQYLLCSDGLTDMVSNLDISTIMRQSESAADCAAALVEAARENGGRDNITVIVCRIKEREK